MSGEKSSTSIVPASELSQRTSMVEIEFRVRTGDRFYFANNLLPALFGKELFDGGEATRLRRRLGEE